MTSAATKLQNRIISGALDSLDNNRDVMIIAPTGAGKSRKFCKIAEDRAKDGERSLILSNRKRLVRQGRQSMNKWADVPVHTTIGIDGDIDLSGDVIFSTVQTAHQFREEIRGIKHVILDEAHNAREENDDYTETLEAIIRNNPGVLLIGATATPPTMYEGMPERLATADKHIMTFEEALAARLVDLPETKMPRMRYKGHETVENIVARKSKNAFGADLENGIATSLAKHRDDDWAEQLVDVYERHLKDRQTLAFFDTVKEASAFVDEMRERKLPVEFVHSGRPTAVTDAILDDFSEKQISLVVAVDMISEGVDVGADGILLDKKSTSAKEYRQIIGRGSRSYGEVKTIRSLLIDTGASTLMHGDIGAQAQMQTLVGTFERHSVSADELLPSRQANGFSPWVPLEGPQAQRPIYATSLDGKIIYAADLDDRFAAFTCSNDKKGRKMELLAIEGERKGMPTRDGFGRWFGDAVRRNEQPLSRLIGNGRTGMSELARIVNDDWIKNAGSIERSIMMMAQQNAPRTIHTEQRAF